MHSDSKVWGYCIQRMCFAYVQRSKPYGIYIIFNSFAPEVEKSTFSHPLLYVVNKKSPSFLGLV